MSHAGWGTSRIKRVNGCHPDAKHYAKGLCRDCYRNQPEFAAMRQRYYRANKQAWKAH